MPRFRIRQLAVVAVAALAIPITATPASAASYEQACFVPGGFGDVFSAKGSGSWDWAGKYDLKPVEMSLTDMASDGHHVAIRLVTKRANGSNTGWTWRHNYDGKGRTITYGTYAHDAAGILGGYFEVATYEGSTQLNSCTTNYAKNPSW
ncbi:hypothetical protein [Streptomyces sp. NBC_01794]|uniref:hypothetical protein n=1 Tax=Streptomyces sp. NBC_01794 TaxID=2975942 RepID=UPI0030902496|nr:hypothetical protein OIE54_28185 [Streptomyces sp. NBC_01794]